MSYRQPRQRFSRRFVAQLRKVSRLLRSFTTAPYCVEAAFQSIAVLITMVTPEELLDYSTAGGVQRAAALIDR